MPNALEILREVNPEAVPAEAPPEVANYRESDLDGVACATCTKFVYTGEGDDEVPVGYCSQWEANVKGDHVSDAFADSSPPLDDQGNEMWEFADESKSVAEVHLAGSTVQADDSGFVIKEVLRTGEWPVIPTGAGVVKQPLRIVRSGPSSKEDGTISLEEVVENFNAGVIRSPQIPLSDDQKDHKNITRLNTGFVRDIWIEGEGDEDARLVAKMEFTEPDVREKVLRGTYADVSCGIPWSVRSQGKTYGTALEHVCITNRPFIDGLGPFLAASDKQDEEIEVAHFGTQPESEEPAPEEQPETTEENPDENSEITLSYEEQRDGILTALRDQLQLSNAYEVSDIEGETAKITNTISEMTWTVPFSVTREDDATSVLLAGTREWKAVEEEGETSDKPAASSGTPRQVSDLEKARRLRELRLSQSQVNEGGTTMSGTLDIEALDGVELSDDQKAAIQEVLSENASLKARTREQEADARIDELKELGLNERPGALKFYRQVMLSDDGGPAVVLLSDDGKEEGRATALEILDSFIEAVKGSDGKVMLSDQALASGNDDPPPADAEGEQKPLKERLADAKKSLYGDDGDEK